jgi:hypothetical protein
MGTKDKTRALKLAAEQALPSETSHFSDGPGKNKPAGPQDVPVHPAPKTGNSPILQAVPPRARLSERRRNLRHKLAAGVVEVIEIESSLRVKAYLGNLGRAGCYVKSETPSPIGTAVNVDIRTVTQSVRAGARVVYSVPGKGMGLLFTAIEAEDLRILESWLEAAVETSWLESSRRRGQRIALSVKVHVAGQNSLGEQIKEPTQTVSISPHGAMVLVSKRVDKGQQLVLRNLRTEAEMECTAVYVARTPNAQYEVGLSFLLPNRVFWGVAFPPADWSIRHPDAKGS